MSRLDRRKTDYFLGLDLSLTGTGIVVLNDQDSVLFAKTLKNKLRGMERLEFILTEIKSVLNTYPPKKVCVEGYSMGSRAGQAFSIGELGGIIKLYLYSQDIDPYIVPPTRLKKFIVGGGKAEKDMIILKVFQRWRWEAADNNQADAYGLSRLAQELSESIEKGFINTNRLNKAQYEVVCDILNPPEKKGKKK